MTPDQIALTKRIHNEPHNPDLGACGCPVCRPDLHPHQQNGGTK